MALKAQSRHFREAAGRGVTALEEGSSMVEEISLMAQCRYSLLPTKKTLESGDEVEVSRIC